MEMCHGGVNTDIERRRKDSLPATLPERNHIYQRIIKRQRKPVSAKRGPPEHELRSEVMPSKTTKEKTNSGPFNNCHEQTIIPNAKLKCTSTQMSDFESKNNSWLVKNKTQTDNVTERKKSEGQLNTDGHRLSMATVSKLGVSEFGRTILRGPNKRFHNVGHKIWNMIKIKNMMMRREEQQEDILLNFNKNKSPKSKRFSSFLSPEAQIAMVKGYEDKTYQNILQLYPESKLFLKRTKTPVTPKSTKQQAVGDVSLLDIEDFESKDKKAESVDDYLSIRGRRSSTSNIPNFSKLFQRNKPPVNRQRSHSISFSIPSDKQRVLSFRLENAMDILDTVSSSQGFTTVSPRLKLYPEPIRPLKAYNKWTEACTNDLKSVI